MRLRSVIVGGALAGVVALAGCSATYRAHGYAPQVDELAQIQPGLDDQLSVRDKIGRPGMLGLANDDAWYYVGTTMEHYTYHQPRPVDRRVVVVMFDENGVVQDIGQYGVEDGQVIDLVTRTTPTYGKELTVVQQLLGNLLNFSTDAM